MDKDTVFVCPNANCGYKGKPNVQSYGSVVVALILMLFFVVPGVLYWLFGTGVRFVCPNCQMQVGKT